MARIIICAENHGGPGTGMVVQRIGSALSQRGHSIYGKATLAVSPDEAMQADLVIGQHRAVGAAKSIATTSGAPFVMIFHGEKFSASLGVDLAVFSADSFIEGYRKDLGDTPAVSIEHGLSDLCDIVTKMADASAIKRREKAIAKASAEAAKQKNVSVPAYTPVQTPVRNHVSAQQIPAHLRMAQHLPPPETRLTKSAGTIRFKIVVPSFNAAPWIRQCVESIFSQRYENFECVIYNDASTDGTGDILRSMVLDDRFRIIHNSVNVGPLENCWNGFNEMGCRQDPDALLMIVDGDDHLVRTDALDIIRSAYEKRPDLLITYGDSAFGSLAKGGTGNAYPPEVVASRSFRKDNTHICHPRTFRSKLWCGIRREDLSDKNTKTFLRVGGDIAFIIPMMEMAGDRVQFIDSVIHLYNTNNPISDFRIKLAAQHDVDSFIRSKPAYGWLEHVSPEKVHYHSQYDQDRFVAESIFNKKRNGVFVDIGAYDGVRLSNTCALERHYGWTGICVEPIPHVFNKLKRARSCTCINGGISNVAESKQFLWVDGPSEMLSGISDAYDSRHLDRIDREVASLGGAKRSVAVQCYRLDELLSSHGITMVDYLSVDVEGAELAVIQSINFQSTYIECISIENNYGDDRIGERLMSNGYSRKAILGCDEIYLRNK